MVAAEDVFGQKYAQPSAAYVRHSYGQNVSAVPYRFDVFIVGAERLTPARRPPRLAHRQDNSAVVSCFRRMPAGCRRIAAEPARIERTGNRRERR